MKLSRTQPAFFRTTINAAVIALLTTSVSFAQESGSVMSKVIKTAHKVEADQPWVDSFDVALKQANATGRPVLLVFSGSDWCGHCIKLNREVFATREFDRWACDNAIMVEVDFPRRHVLAEKVRLQNQALKAKYGQHVKYYPTVLMIDADGTALAGIGYDGNGSRSFINAASAMIRSVDQYSEQSDNLAASQR